MILIGGGTFLMGSARCYPEEAPAHRVRVDAFRSDPTPVTNAECAAFVTATGYLTEAERGLHIGGRRSTLVYQYLLGGVSNVDIDGNSTL